MKIVTSTLRGTALLLVLGAAAPAPGQTTVTFSPSHDAYVNDSAPADNFNTAFLVVGKSTKEFLPRYRSFLRFNLASIPAGAVITGATLRLNLQSVEGGGTQSIEVHRALATWSATTVTWNNQPAHRRLPWRLRTGTCVCRAGTSGLEGPGLSYPVRSI